MRPAGQDQDGNPLSQILVDSTPFYGTSGGQVGDGGTLEIGPDTLRVQACEKSSEGNVLVVAGAADQLCADLRAHPVVRMRVDADARRETMRHHTATHLLHATLREILGDHVEQAGSEVTPEHLRFDFLHDKAVTPEELARIEAI
ncbi:alanine--tRNA ligase, partial [bacterium DOLZORAL124_64_63]